MKLIVISKTEKTFKIKRNYRSTYRDIIKKSEIDHDNGWDFFSSPEKAIEEAKKEIERKIERSQRELDTYLWIREYLNWNISAEE